MNASRAWWAFAAIAAVGLGIWLQIPRTCWACSCPSAGFQVKFTPNLNASEFPASITQNEALRDNFLTFSGVTWVGAYSPRLHSISFPQDDGATDLTIYLKDR